MPDCFIDAVTDSLKLFPFLFLIYLFLEAVEHSSRVKAFNERVGKGKLAPLGAGLVSLVPECGFSVMAASLFSKGIIALGTLLTVFIVTSDEGIPILLASSHTAKVVLPIMAIKFCFGVIVGFFCNAIFKTEREQKAAEEREFHDHNCHEKTKLQIYFTMPLLRTFKVLLFVFIVNLAMNLLIFFVGEETFLTFLGQRKLLQILIAPMVGVIPGCGSSVILATAYQDGVLSFSALLSGLTVNSGIGLSVLFRQNKNLKQNLAILFTLYGLSILLGLVLMLFE